MGDVDRLRWWEKVRLAVRVWLTFLRVSFEVRARPLPEAVAKLGDASASEGGSIDPRRLGRIVFRLLRLGPWGARCLYNALVLYRLLRRDGMAATLVIGLPIEAKDKDAHAWVELHGRDVGPPPGRAGHEELARFG